MTGKIGPRRGVDVLKVVRPVGISLTHSSANKEIHLPNIAETSALKKKPQVRTDARELHENCAAGYFLKKRYLFLKKLSLFLTLFLLTFYPFLPFLPFCSHLLILSRLFSDIIRVP